MAKLEQRTGSGRERKKLGLAPGGFLAPKSRPPVGVKLKNKLNRAGDAISRKVDVIASNAATKKRNRQEEKSSRITEEPTLTINTSDNSNTTIGRDTSPSASDRFSEIVLGQPIANPNIYAANLAGGSRPMTAMDNPQIDPVTGMPITPGGQPNMNPNFIGGMSNSNMPTTGMLAQEKAKTIPAQNPGVYKSYDLSKPQPNEFDVKTSSGTRLGSGGDSEVAWRSYANDVTKPTTSGKGISGKALSSLMHLERHGQTSRMYSGPLKSPTEKINDGFKKGYDTYLEKPKVNQDKKMPTGPEGKGIRGLATSVQENMGYDPLSQERLTQSRRGTKCMRVKRK